jgi:molybdopterin converting factor small subunit
VVTARLFAAAAEAVGGHEVTVDARDVGALRVALGAAGASSALDAVAVIRQCAILEGGVRREDGHVLNDGAVVDVLPPFAGG